MQKIENPLLFHTAEDGESESDGSVDDSDVDLLRSLRITSPKRDT